MKRTQDLLIRDSYPCPLTRAGPSYRVMPTQESFGSCPGRPRVLEFAALVRGTGSPSAGPPGVPWLPGPYPFGETWPRRVRLVDASHLPVLVLDGGDQEGTHPLACLPDCSKGGMADMGRWW
jgi:hypothetical protein